jgi:hypothetical protein
MSQDPDYSKRCMDMSYVGRQTRGGVHRRMILRTIYSSSPHSGVHLMRLLHVLVESVQGGTGRVRLELWIRRGGGEGDGGSVESPDSVNFN